MTHLLKKKMLCLVQKNMKIFSIFGSFLGSKIYQKSTFFNLLEGFVSRTLLVWMFDQCWVNFERVKPQSTRHGAVETHVRPFCGKRVNGSNFNETRPPKRLIKSQKTIKMLF